MFETILEELMRIAKEKEINTEMCINPAVYEDFCIDATFEIDILYPDADFCFYFDYVTTDYCEPPHFVLSVDDIRRVVTL